MNRSISLQAESSVSSDATEFVPLFGHRYTELWQILNTSTSDASLAERSLKTYFSACFVEESEIEGEKLQTVKDFR